MYIGTALHCCTWGWYRHALGLRSTYIVTDEILPWGGILPPKPNLTQVASAMHQRYRLTDRRTLCSQHKCDMQKLKKATEDAGAQCENMTTWAADADAWQCNWWERIGLSKQAVLISPKLITSHYGCSGRVGRVYVQAEWSLSRCNLRMSRHCCACSLDQHRLTSWRLKTLKLGQVGSTHNVYEA